MAARPDAAFVIEVPGQQVAVCIPFGVGMRQHKNIVATGQISGIFPVVLVSTPVGSGWDTRSSQPSLCNIAFVFIQGPVGRGSQYGVYWNRDGRNSSGANDTLAGPVGYPGVHRSVPVFDRDDESAAFVINAIVREINPVFDFGFIDDPTDGHVLIGHQVVHHAVWLETVVDGL